MSVSTTSNRIQYTGDGSTVNFTVPFQYYDQTSLRVYVNSVLKTLTTDYTVSPTTNTPHGTIGGTVTFLAAPANGLAVLIVRQITNTQNSVLQDLSKFPATTVEQMADLLTFRNQEQDETIGRAITIPVTSTLSNLSIPDPALPANQGMYLQTYSGGIQLVSGTISSTPNPLNAKGDLITSAGGTTPSRLAVGADGTVLKADSTQTGGLRYATIQPSFGSVGQTSKNNTGTPNSQYDLNANYVRLWNPTTGDIVQRVAPGVITNNVLTAGSTANGRDQAGTFGTSVWVHFYWIWNGTTLASLSSLSAPTTGPTLPSGYTHWCYATSVYYDSSPNLRLTRTLGNVVWYEYAAGGTTRALSAGNSNTMAAVSLASLIPPNAELVYVTVLLQIIHNALALFTAYWRPTGSSITGAPLASIGNQVVSQITSNTNTLVMVPGTSSSIDYKLDTTPSGGGGIDLTVTAYKIPNGGE